MDSSGNLYGTAYADGAFSYGSAFKLAQSNGVWAYTSLHDFTGSSDGGNPISNVVSNVSGNLYGTTYNGGTGDCDNGFGVVYLRSTNNPTNKMR